MATRFIDKEYGATTTTAIIDDTTGKRKIKNLPDAAGLNYDKVDNTFKYNGNDAIMALQTSTARTVTPTGATTLTALQSGSVIFLNAAAGFAITLPAPAAGLNYRIVTAAAFATTDFTVVSNGGANVIFGGADVNSTWVPADAEDTITFVATAETKGDWIYLVSDGTGWFVGGQATAAGAITFTAT